MTHCLLAPFPAALSLISSIAAQLGGTGADGPLLVATGTTTLDTSNRPGGFDFTTITVAAGAQLRLAGSHPARLRAQGAVIIDGLVNADGFAPGAPPTPGAGGPGGFAGGVGGSGGAGTGGGPGGGCAGVATYHVLASPGPASHATVAQALSWCGATFGSPPPAYGSAWPFDTRGGSGSGGFAERASVGLPGSGGNGGGGTVLLAADGVIVVRGRIRAKSPPGRIVPSAAGSILVQSTVGLQISGAIDADRTVDGTLTAGGAGHIRLDTYGAPAVIVGTVTPTPMTVVLPRFRDVSAPIVGTNWNVQLDSLPNDVLGVWVSSRSASLPLPPFGVLRLDPTAGLTLLGTATMTPSSTGLEATGSLTVAIPNDPSLRGLTLHAQALNVVTQASAPRLTELLTVSVQ